uniref:Mannosyltransferase n=1 Tax=Timema bartmani TaxID=61472 RepID=A0A7R9F1J7_9NEOP|nr:unnamed protein product [Timema bartmani]
MAGQEVCTQKAKPAKPLAFTSILNTLFPLDEVDTKRVIVGMNAKNKFTPYVQLEKGGGNCSLFNRTEWQELDNYKSPPQKICVTNHEISLRRMCCDRVVVISEKKDPGLKWVAYLAPSWARIFEVWDLIDVTVDRRNRWLTPIARYCNDIVDTLVVNLCDMLTQSVDAIDLEQPTVVTHIRNLDIISSTYYTPYFDDGIETLVTVLIALHSWLRQQHGYFIFSSAAAIIIFRAELALFLGLILILELVQSRLHPVRLIKLAVTSWPAVPSAHCRYRLCVLGQTALARRGSFVLQHCPKQEPSMGCILIMFYNTSPFLWYFYSAIPRGMACSVFLVPIGAYLDTRVRKLLIPAIGFVVLFSFLPHKELRFIIYVFPLLNIAAASACHRIFENRSKSSLHSMLALGVCCHLVLNSTFSVFLLCIAGTNYPGGAAIARLHRLAKDEPYVNVHIAVLAAQTGVSRFTQINRHWRYNKTENLTSGSDEMMAFTHLLVEAKSKYSSNLKPYAQTHDILEVIEGFSQVVLNYNSFPPIRIKTKPMIFILKRRIFSMHVEKTMVKTDIEDVEDKSKVRNVDGQEDSVELSNVEMDYKEENSMEMLDDIKEAKIKIDDDSASTKPNLSPTKVKQNIRNIIKHYKEEISLKEFTSDENAGEKEVNNDVESELPSSKLIQKDIDVKRKSIKEDDNLDTQDFIVADIISINKDLLKDDIKLQIKDILKEEIKYKNRDLLKEEVKLKNKDLLKGEIKPKNKDALKREINSKNKDALKEEIKHKNKDLMREEIQLKNKDELKAEVKPKIKGALKEEIKHKNKDLMKEEIQPKNKDELKAEVKPKNIGALKEEIKHKNKGVLEEEIQPKNKDELKEECLRSTTPVVAHMSAEPKIIQQKQQKLVFSSHPAIQVAFSYSFGMIRYTTFRDISVVRQMSPYPLRERQLRVQTNCDLRQVSCTLGLTQIHRATGTKTFTHLKTLLETRYAPTRSVYEESSAFSSLKQRGGESYAAFSLYLRHLATTCSFETLINDTLKLQFYHNISSYMVRDKIRNE